MSTVEAKNVWKIYEGNVEAVRDANFFCDQEQFVAILGPSGCGKSSTLRMLAGLEDITKGEILFDGKVVNQLSARERNIALAFESYALYSPLTIFDNIAFPLQASGLEKQEIKRKVYEIAEFLELKDVLKRKPGKLSGGQQQRVSLARALVRDPSVLLLDEPLSHMDQRVRTIIRARIRKIHDEMSATTIYVTHDQEEAVALADKIIVMNFGEIQQVGTADDLWHYPANQFVAGFIGDPPMNFLTGKIDSENSVALVNGADPITWKITENIPASAIDAGVQVGIRPDKIKIATQSTEFGIKARVEVIEFLGEFLILTLSIDHTEIKVIIPPDFTVREQDDVWVWGEPDDIHLFDAKHGKALIKFKD
ncbi:MAG: ABC transporter ATP-binding protein [bacterium]|nr:ABC transporter ATP-binding protein [bacterium]